MIGGRMVWRCTRAALLTIGHARPTRSVLVVGVCCAVCFEFWCSPTIWLFFIAEMTRVGIDRLGHFFADGGVQSHLGGAALQGYRSGVVGVYLRRRRRNQNTGKAAC